jgi:hypothetical protein
MYTLWQHEGVALRHVHKELTKYSPVWKTGLNMYPAAQEQFVSERGNRYAQQFFSHVFLFNIIG